MFLRPIEKKPENRGINFMLPAFPVVQGTDLGQSGKKYLPDQEKRQNSDS
jgi:hypothetical protein